MDTGIARHVFFLATGMVPHLGVGALRKLRTLHIGSGGGTDFKFMVEVTG